MVPGEEDRLEVLHDARLAEAEVLGVDDGRVDQVEPQRVRAVRVDHEDGVGVVLLALGHLLAVGREHKPVADQVLEGGLVEEGGREHHEGVEPAACLVDALGDEVGREGGLERLLVLEGVVLLRVRHRARLEPAVEDLVDALEGSLALLRGELDVVDELAVQVAHHHAREPLKLLLGADDDDLLAVVRDPHRDRRPPEAVARDGPVARVLEPVLEALLTYVARHPVRLLVVGDQLLLDGLDRHEGARDGAVDERRVRAPAEGVRVVDDVHLDDAPLRLEVGNDVLVRLLDAQPLPFGYLVAEPSVRVDWAYERLAAPDHSVLEARLVVLLAKGGCAMHDAGARVVGDEAACDDAERAGRAPRLEVAEGRRVLHARERRAGPQFPNPRDWLRGAGVET
mmetsp:Transcript_41508/g.130922  ORF Transcript_41508/g.130922 Transcript_41508/m.130922 type:complete len:397 (-) Transcript_41508:157-1347(-)